VFSFGKLKTASRLFSATEKVSRRVNTLELSSLPERTRGRTKLKTYPALRTEAY
jgi:vacuolar-type H+-ATPase subunit D/Vma8